jgi:hypothetical protein
MANWMDDEGTAGGKVRHRPVVGRNRAVAIVGTCLIILLVAYGLLSTSVVNGVANAVGGRPNTSFVALSFAHPKAVSAYVVKGTPVEVAVSNQSPHSRTFDWSTSSSGVTLQRGSIAVPGDSTRTFVVQTEHVQSNNWFSVKLDRTSLAITAWVV